MRLEIIKINDSIHKSYFKQSLKYVDIELFKQNFIKLIGKIDAKEGEEHNKNIVSDFGKIIDPIADKILVVGVFLAFLQIGVVDVWFVVIIVLREFLVTGLRLYALARNYVLEAKSYGKHKTFSQMAGIAIIIIMLILNKMSVVENGIFFLVKTGVILWIAVITIFSGAMYLWKNKKLINTL